MHRTCHPARTAARPSVVTALLLALLATLLVVQAPAASAADKDCADFATQKDAQLFFLDAGGPASDPHGLDHDGDGIACESNPCPCYTGTQAPTSPPPAAAPKPFTQFGRVVKVVDGDTVDVRLRRSGRKARVRLIGIDTPEVYGGVECGGPEASAALRRLLPAGTRVRMRNDVTQDTRDRYGRLLRYVHKARNGRDVNRAQLWHGRGEVYVYAGTPFTRVASYRRAQAEAQEAERGIWGAC